MSGDKRLLDCKPVDRRFSKGVTGPQTVQLSPLTRRLMIRWAIQCEQKNFDRMDVINAEAKRGADPGPMTHEEQMALDIADMGLELRTVNKLESRGITRLGQLLNHEGEVLLTIGGLGEKTVADIRAAANKALGRDAA